MIESNIPTRVIHFIPTHTSFLARILNKCFASLIRDLTEFSGHPNGEHVGMHGFNNQSRPS